MLPPICDDEDEGVNESLPLEQFTTDFWLSLYLMDVQGRDKWDSVVCVCGCVRVCGVHCLPTYPSPQGQRMN